MSLSMAILMGDDREVNPFSCRQVDEDKPEDPTNPERQNSLIFNSFQKFDDLCKIRYAVDRIYFHE